MSNTRTQVKPSCVMSRSSAASAATINRSFNAENMAVLNAFRRVGSASVISKQR
ncbi:MAG: hypothetical protein NT059_01440 [Planctomycetota bacterium]|nr:hypothetical protein [Planctomycetota bacterium]